MSSIIRLRILPARPAADDVADDRAIVARLRQRRAMRVADIGFVASQERRPELHRARAEHKGRRRRASVRHRHGDHRHADRVDDFCGNGAKRPGCVPIIDIG